MSNVNNANNSININLSNGCILPQNLIVFVPEYVHLSDIDQCIQDRNAFFVSVNKQSLNTEIDAARRIHRRIMVLERNHFAFYIDGYPEPFRCCYRSRNLVMTDLRYMDSFPPMFFNYWPLALRNGLWSANQLPRLFFVNTDDYSYIHSSSADAHTIVEYYSCNDTTDMLDFDRFACIARAKTTCAQHFFVVKKGSLFIAVDTNNTDFRYSFTTAIKTRVIRDLSARTETVQSLVAAKSQLQMRRIEMLPQPGFELADSAGCLLKENDTFRLQIMRHPRQAHNDNDDTGAALSSDRQEYLCATLLGQATKKVVIHGSVSQGAVFSTKNINGIVYLTLNNNFVIIPQSQNDDLTTSSSIPAKSQRIQFHYDKDRNILLSRWRDCVFA
ncbi:hypothetical protein FB639_005263, partial [Coemansia asiatica]